MEPEWNIIKLIRTEFQAQRTFGEMQIPGLGFFKTVEDAVRDEKVYGETAIWEGEYELLLRKEESPMWKRWSEKNWIKEWGGFKWFIELQDVKDFKHIYIHTGNDEDDSLGCILPGMIYNKVGNVPIGVASSRQAMIKIYDYLTPKLEAGEKWKIVIVNDASA